MASLEQIEAEVSASFNGRMKLLIGNLQTDLVEAQTRGERLLIELAATHQELDARARRIVEQQDAISEQRNQIVELREELAQLKSKRSRTTG